MATEVPAGATPNPAGKNVVGQNEHYERICLELSPLQAKEIEEAKDLLDLVLCSIPKEKDCDTKEELMKETAESIERGKKLLP